jgi:formate dehydrogenase maturation protein FdhE
MSGFCGFVVDELITDKYGDRRTSKSHSNDSFNIKFPYGSSVNHVMEPADIVKYLLHLWGDSALILKYNMDKATDNWEQCPHCGSNNTDYEETEGGGDHERFEYMSCRDCDCNWTNVYDPAKRKERYLDN